MLLGFLVTLVIHVNSYNKNPLPFVWQRGATYGAIMGDKTNPMYGHYAVEVEYDNEKATEYWSSDKLEAGKTYKIRQKFIAKDHKLEMWINGKKQNLHIIYPQPTSAKWRPYLDHPFITGRREGHTDRDFDGTIKVKRVTPVEYGHPRQ